MAHCKDLNEGCDLDGDGCICGCNRCNAAVAQEAEESEDEEGAGV